MSDTRFPLQNTLYIAATNVRRGNETAKALQRAHFSRSAVSFRAYRILLDDSQPEIGNSGSRIAARVEAL
jgi:hypothetical protein